MFAVETAQRVLQWQENLSSEETPPQWMWALDDELENWFKTVEEKRNEKYGISHDEGSEMVSNDLARSRR